MKNSIRQNQIAGAARVLLLVLVVSTAIGFATQDPTHVISTSATNKPESIDSVKNRLKQMPADQLHQLKRDREDFEKLAPLEQQRLRDFHGKLNTHTNKDELVSVMHTYYKWLGTLKPHDRAILLDMKNEDRIEEIRRLMALQDLEWFAKAGQTERTRLPEKDAVPVYEWYQDALRRNWDRINSWAIEYSEQGRYFGRTYKPSWELSESDRKRFAFYKLGTAKRLVSGMYEFDQELLTGIIPEEDIEYLKRIVSPEANKIISASGNQSLLVVNWFQTALELKEQQTIPKEKLYKFLSSMSTEERDSLNKFSLRERDRIVRKMYYERVMSTK